MTQGMNALVPIEERFRWLVNEFDRRVTFSIPWLDSFRSNPYEESSNESLVDQHSHQLLLRKLDYWVIRRPIVFVGIRFALDVTHELLRDVDCECRSDDRAGGLYSSANEQTSWNKWWVVFDQSLKEYSQNRHKIFRLDFRATTDAETLYRGFCEGFRSTTEYIFGSMDRGRPFGAKAFMMECIKTLSLKRGTITELFPCVPMPSYTRIAA